MKRGRRRLSMPLLSQPSLCFEDRQLVHHRRGDPRGLDGSFGLDSHPTDGRTRESRAPLLGRQRFPHRVGAHGVRLRARADPPPGAGSGTAADGNDRFAKAHIQTKGVVPPASIAAGRLTRRCSHAGCDIDGALHSRSRRRPAGNFRPVARYSPHGGRGLAPMSRRQSRQTTTSSRSRVGDRLAVALRQLPIDTNPCLCHRPCVFV